MREHLYKQKYEQQKYFMLHKQNEEALEIWYINVTEWQIDCHCQTQQPRMLEDELSAQRKIEEKKSVIERQSYITTHGSFIISNLLSR